MKKRGFFLLIIIFSAMFVLSAIPAFAQGPDIDSMSNEELLLLLQSIMQKLEQDETSPDTAEPVPTEPAAGPLAVNGSKSEPEIRLFEVYENKKLIVEALPSYMFIQPTQPPKPEPEEPEPDKKNDGGDDSNNGGSNNNNNNNDNYGSCPPQVSCGMSLCTYSITPDGECVCRCG